MALVYAIGGPSIYMSIYLSKVIDYTTKKKKNKIYRYIERDTWGYAGRSLHIYGHEYMEGWGGPH